MPPGMRSAVASKGTLDMTVDDEAASRAAFAFNHYQRHDMYVHLQLQHAFIGQQTNATNKKQSHLREQGGQATYTDTWA